MKETTKKFVQLLESQKIRYEIREIENRSDCVCVCFSGDNASSIATQFFFHPDEENIAVRVFSIARVPQEKTEDTLRLLNRLMNEYRWVRLYLDEDNEITAAIDAVISPDTAGPIAHELLMRVVSIVDDVYPQLMKEIWS